METTLKTALFILLFAFILQFQYNLDADKTATRQLKNAVELATHDAALAIKPEEFSEGKVIFNEEQANKNFIKSIEKNLNVTHVGGNVFAPNEDSFYKDNIHVQLDYIDHSDVDVNYPYNYVDANYNLIGTLSGPSVVAIISTESPRWFKGDSVTIRQAAIYEYIK